MSDEWWWTCQKAGDRSCLAQQCQCRIAHSSTSEMHTPKGGDYESWVSLGQVESTCESINKLLDFGCIRWQSFCSGASAVSLHREKAYEECSIEIQDCLTEQCVSDKFTMFTMFMWFDFTTCPLGPSWPEHGSMALLWWAVLQYLQPSLIPNWGLEYWARLLALPLENSSLDSTLAVHSCQTNNRNQPQLIKAVPEGMWKDYLEESALETKDTCDRRCFEEYLVLRKILGPGDAVLLESGLNCWPFTVACFRASHLGLRWAAFSSIPEPWMFAKYSWQDSRNLPNSVPGNVNGKTPIQTAKRSHSESRSDSVRIEAACSQVERRLSGDQTMMTHDTIIATNWVVFPGICCNCKCSIVEQIERIEHRCCPGWICALWLHSFPPRWPAETDVRRKCHWCTNSMLCISLCHLNSFCFLTLKAFKLFTVWRLLELQYAHTPYASVQKLPKKLAQAAFYVCSPKSWVVHVHFLSLLTERLGLEPQWIKDKKPLSRDWRVAAARAVEDAMSASMSGMRLNMSPCHHVSIVPAGISNRTEITLVSVWG